MKVIILAAGKGTRMLPLTKDVPKVLIKINGKPFLYYLLKSLQRAGNDDLGVIVGYKKEKIRDFLEKFNVKAELIEQKEQLGTGDAVMRAESFVDGEDFLVLNGDSLWDVETLKRIRKEDSFNYICGVEVSHPEKYGVLVLNKDFLKEIKEKPKEFYGNLVNTGLYKFKPEIFKALKKIGNSERGEIELTGAISILAEENKVKVIKTKEWLDLGCKEDIKIVSHFLKENWKE